MIRTHKKGVPFYQFPNFEPFPGIVHGIFSRLGGASPPPYDSLNTGFDLGDDGENVKKNRDTIARCLDLGSLVEVKQVHGDRVVVIGSKGAGPTPGDALVTNLPGKALVIKVADCQAVLLYDPVKHVVANLHSGWRGSIKNVIGRTIEVMVREFDCLPGHIMAGVGPSLGPCCAEFINYLTEVPSRFWRYKDPEDHFDFWTASRDQLRNAGVAAKNIFCSGMCTRCRVDTFFSYRAEGLTGRFAAVIGLRS